MHEDFLSDSRVVINRVIHVSTILGERSACIRHNLRRQVLVSTRLLFALMLAAFDIVGQKLFAIVRLLLLGQLAVDLS